MKVFCATLGCDKNLVDSEALLGRFANRGVQVVADPDPADIWILNTCGFIDAARSDSEETLQELCEAKEDRLLVVCGCWTQEHGQEIQDRYPAVDVIAGVGQFDRVIAACLDEPKETADDGLDTRAFPQVGQPIIRPPEEAQYTGLMDRPLLTPPHVAFVKIAEGCNCHCTFCRIPMIRGKQASRPIAEIRREVELLTERGVTEIQIVSQNTSDFGRDTGEKLYDLVRELSQVDALRRMRLLYLYAGLVTTDDLLRLLDLPKVAPYLDLPVQHASRRLLKAMRRPGGEAGTAPFFNKLRTSRPDLVLRSTALLGFPGEEDDDVAQLADFLAEVEFDHLGTYRYSPEAGTPAADLPDRIPDEVILDREALIMDLQTEISQKRQTARLGKVFDLVIDDVVTADSDEDAYGAAEVLASLAEGDWLDESERSDLIGVGGRGERFAVGRSEHYGYDLDGIVLLPAGDLKPGQWVRGEFRAATPFDTWAVVR